MMVDLKQVFLDDYFKAAETSKPEDWLQAALSAKQWQMFMERNPVIPDYAEIYVGGGEYAICDWSDWDLVKPYKWSLTSKKSSCLYAQAWNSEKVKGRKKISMHRLIMGDNLVDHINGNGLDNRRSNLRFATIQQNSFNQKARPGSSKYKGVSFDKDAGLWRAYITLSGKRIHLGKYANETDAARAYDIKAKEIFGEYAKYNI